MNVLRLSVMSLVLVGVCAVATAVAGATAGAVAAVLMLGIVAGHAARLGNTRSASPTTKAELPR
jgi:hypothetical protein